MKKMGIGNRAESQICMACRWWTMSKKLANRSVVALCLGLVVLGFACVLWAQSSSAQSSPQQSPTPSTDPQQDQNIPDAPSTVQPPKPAPENPPRQEQVPPEAAPEQPQAPPPPN